MSEPSNLARSALWANGMVWFGSALFIAGMAGERTSDAFTGTWANMLGWVLLLLVAASLAVVGGIENRNIRRKRPRG